MNSEDQQTPSPSQDSEVILGKPLFQRPTIPNPHRFILPSNHYPTTKSAQEIFTVLGRERALFVRGKIFMEVVTHASKKHSELSEIKPHQLGNRMEHHGELYTHSIVKDKLVLAPSRCSEREGKDLLGTLEARELLPSIDMVVNSPILVEGKYGVASVLTHGYHDYGGGIFVSQGELPPDVQLPEATDSLIELLRDFDFETPTDMAKALALILTPALLWGGFFKNASIPMFLVEANHSQAGKGYLLHMIAAIYGETLIPRAPRRGGVGSFDEDFNSALLQGKPLIMFDNLRDALDSPHIESFLTAPGSFSVRTPHRAAFDIDVRNYIILATSNSFGTTKDLENRLLRLHILKRPSSYRFTSYKGKDALTQGV
jgi:hypothetical protein